MRILKYFGERFVVNVRNSSIGGSTIPIEMGYGETVRHLKEKIGARVLSLELVEERSARRRPMTNDDELLSNRSSSSTIVFSFIPRSIIVDASSGP